MRWLHLQLSSHLLSAYFGVFLMCNASFTRSWIDLEALSSTYPVHLVLLLPLMLAYVSNTVLDVIAGLNIFCQFTLRHTEN